MSAPTVLITGLGLMGGSLAAALSRAGWLVLLHHRRPEVAARAQALGYGRQVDDPVAAMAGCQLAVVGTPVGVIAETVRRLAAGGGKAVITDVGSTKGTICAALADLAASGRFVGSHPMAGSHAQGLEHADAGLYRDCVCVVTPVPGTPAPAVAAVEAMWQAVGARLLRMTPAAHDEAVAEASHLPHILASATAAGLGEVGLPLAATGFRDTTRIAAAGIELWTQILIENRHAIGKRLHDAQARLQVLAAALDRGDAAAVSAWLTAGREGRRRFDEREK